MWSHLVGLCSSHRLDLTPHIFSSFQVHRDIKPQNLLLMENRADAVLKIADFGFARHLEGASMADTLCGASKEPAHAIFCDHMSLICTSIQRGLAWSCPVCVCVRMVSPHLYLVITISSVCSLVPYPVGLSLHITPSLTLPLRPSPSLTSICPLCPFSGSPLYMAPEILGQNPYNNKADLWSVGAVLFEMVAGRPPFAAQNQVTHFPHSHKH